MHQGLAQGSLERGQGNSAPPAVTLAGACNAGCCIFTCAQPCPGLSGNTVSPWLLGMGNPFGRDPQRLALHIPHGGVDKARSGTPAQAETSRREGS